MTIFSIYQNTKQQKLAEFIRLAATLAFSITLTLKGMGTMESYAWTWNYGAVIAAFFSFFVVWRHHLGPLIKNPDHFSINTHYLKELFTYGMWSLLTLNIGIILSQIDMQLLILLRGTEDAGYYSNYLSLIGIPFVFTSPIIGFIFPVVSSYAGSNNTDKLLSIRTTFTRLFSIIGFVTTVVFFLYGKDLGVFFF